MNLLHGIVLVLLCVIILRKVKVPYHFKKVGVVPVAITLLFLVVYLFTQSPVLGVVGLVAAYEMMQRPLSLSLPSDGDLTPISQFQETLEEYLVKRIVPLTHTTIAPIYRCVNDDTHNASLLDKE